MKKYKIDSEKLLEAIRKRGLTIYECGLICGKSKHYVRNWYDREEAPVSGSKLLFENCGIPVSEYVKKEPGEHPEAISDTDKIKAITEIIRGEKETRHMNIYVIAPIDLWYGAQVADSEMTDYILDIMPEAPRRPVVFVTHIPVDGNCWLSEVYMCKADNNGTVYLFSEDELSGFEKM